ncbi:MAG: hypothetical protein H6696_04230 [Deferribacteres bacterium]|nr:hypothetical protein [candidate division KSB1 bacterium]MCB9501122.1 hypothetical protein [Deferribacteres bacterium]
MKIIADAFFPAKLIKLLFVLSPITLFMFCGKITAPADIEPPESPANFTLIGGGDGQAHFRWSKNVEPDFDKYLIYRSVGDINTFTLIGETRQNEFVDVFLSYEIVYYYYITAIDFADNESEPTGVIDVRPINISSPASPTNVTVYGHNYPNLNQLEFVITWAPPNVSDLLMFRIYRGTDPSFQVNETTLIDSTSVGIYYDRNVNLGDTYYYKITSVDIGLKSSLPSVANGDWILNSAELTNPSNRIEFTSPYQFSWKPVQNAKAYKVFVALSPLADTIWTSPKSIDTTALYQGTDFTANSIYYWWVAAYSKEDSLNVDKNIKIIPDINSRSLIRTFFVR